MQFKNLFLSICILPLGLVDTYAQETTDTTTLRRDSMKNAAIEQMALLNPRLRQLTVSYQDQRYGDIRGKNKSGEDIYSGKLRTAVANINMNIPVWQTTRNTLVLSVGVQHQFLDLKDRVDYTPQTEHNDIDNYSAVSSLRLSYSSNDKLFGKTVYSTVSVGGLFTPAMDASQITVVGLATMPLVTSADTKFSIGAAVMWNPSSPAPFFPFFTYYHKFRSINTDLIVDLPSRIAIRKEITPTFSVAATSEMVGTNSLFKLNSAIPGIPEHLAYSTLDIKSGLLFEYRFTKKLIFSLGGGIDNNLRSRVLENNKKVDDYIINNKYKPTPYFQVGLSLLPFWKGLNF